MIFQGLGGLVCISFALQGVVILVGPAMGQRQAPSGNFYDAAHWASEGSLCLLVGLVGSMLEMRAFFPSISAHFVRLMCNRLVLALGYLWLGAYSMGGRIQDGGEAWRTAAEATGLVAWVVCAADLLLSCCSDRHHSAEHPDAPGDAKLPQKAASRGSDSTTTEEDISDATSTSSRNFDAAQPDGTRFAV